METFLFKLQGEILYGRLPSDAQLLKIEKRRKTSVLSNAVMKITESLRPAVIAEIGAHEASFSTQLKRAVPTSRVIAVEANPAVWSQYEPGLAEAGVEYVHKCISDRPGSVRFSVPIHDTLGDAVSMGSTLVDTAYTNFHSYEVEAISFDELLGPDVDKDSALWIDVEGAIGAVLDGARKALSSCLLLYAETETKQRWVGQRTIDDVIPQLRSFGLVPVLRDVQRPWQFNVLFLREDVLARSDIQKLCFAAARDLSAEIK